MRFFFCKSAREDQVRDIVGCCTKSLLVIVHITNLAIPLSLAPKFKLSQPFMEKSMSDAMRIWLYNRLMKLQKANLFMLCDVILLVRLQDKFELDHSW